MSLLQLLLSQERLPLLIILAYRDNEVDSSHPLTKLINTARSDASQHMREVHLRPLGVQHCQQLLVDTLRCSQQGAAPLAQLVHAKTQGNPFFVSKLLQTWHLSGLLAFDCAAGEWRWSLETLRVLAVADDVVVVLAAQIQTLSTAAQTLLQYAACSGNTFSLLTLSHITQLPTLQLVRAACESEAAGLVNTISHAQDLLLLREKLEKEHTAETQAARRDAEAEFTLAAAAPQCDSEAYSNLQLLARIQQRFQHDRIQSAALALVPPSQLSAVHCTIAGQLLSLDEAEAAEYAMEIAAHINRGFVELKQRDQQRRQRPEQVSTTSAADMSPVRTFDEAMQQRWHAFFDRQHTIERVVHMEITAAQQASAASTYDAAVKFLSAALFLLDMAHAADQSPLPAELRARGDPADAIAAAASNPAAAAVADPACDFICLPLRSWQRAFDTCALLYSELARALFLSSSHVASVQCIEYAFTRMARTEDRAPLFELHVIALGVQVKLQEAVGVGLEHLSELGVELSSDMPPELQQWIYAGVEKDGVVQHPVFELEEMADPIALQLAGALIPPLYLVRSPLFNSCVLAMLRLTKDRGLAPESALAFSQFGICIWPFGQLQSMFHVACIAQQILDHFGERARYIQPRSHMGIIGSCFPWKKPLREVVALLSQAFENAFHIGDGDCKCLAEA